MLILPSYNYEEFSFVYLTDKSVNMPIKSLILSQNQLYHKDIYKMTSTNQVHELFRKTAINNLDPKQQTDYIMNTLYELSGNINFLKKSDQVMNKLKEYKLTLDNFFKMCLIIYRSKSNVPSIIMGQSGVGKTALIKFLVEVIHQ